MAISTPSTSAAARTQGTKSESIVSSLGETHIIISKSEYRSLKSEVKRWKTLHAKALEREKKLKEKLAEKKGIIRKLQQRSFGDKSEKGKKKNESKKKGTRKARGQRKGSKGHGRTLRPNLEERKEESKLPKTPQCPKCANP